MRYLLVTYDETSLPATGYDLHEKVMQFLADEGIECGIADLHSPRGVEEHVFQQDMAAGGTTLEQHLFELATSLEIIADNLSAVPETGEFEEHIRAVWDEVALMDAKLDALLHPDKEVDECAS